MNHDERALCPSGEHHIQNCPDREVCDIHARLLALGFTQVDCLPSMYTRPFTGGPQSLEYVSFHVDELDAGVIHGYAVANDAEPCGFNPDDIDTVETDTDGKSTADLVAELEAE